MEKHDPEDKKALGKRLASCREVKGWKQEYAAEQLGVTKAALSAWETGRNMPDALTLKLIAKVYDVSIDGILWDNSISLEAMQFAAQFDNLNDKQQRSFRAMWLAYFEQAVSDDHVEDSMPITRHRRATDAVEIREGEKTVPHLHQRKTDRK
jgi:transcriptional regulator with XRE-family HTH domain